MSIRQNVPTIGWHAEVITDSGAVHAPDLLDDPQRIPKTNGLPQIEIPVRRNEKWLDPEFEQAGLRVWCDGKRQPIDQLDTVELTADRTVLRGRGGIELKEPVDVQYSQAAIHEVAEELIEEYTSYTANVDPPDVELEEDVEVATVTTTEDFINEFEVKDTDPVWIAAGSIRLFKTCVVKDAVDNNHGAFGVTEFSGPAPSGDKAYRFTSADNTVVFHIRFPYRIPAEHVGIRVRDRVQGDSDVSFHWNGREFERLDQGDTGEGWGWVEIGSDSHYDGQMGWQTVIASDIHADTDNWFKVVAQDASDYELDVIAFYDQRYSYTWDNYAPAGEYLEGPEEYPDSVWISSRELPQTRAVVGGTLDATVNSTNVGGGSEFWTGFSHTQGEYYQTGGSDSPTHVNREPGSFATPGGSMKFGAVLGRWGDNPNRSQIPTKGFETHHIHDYTIEADLSTLPVIVNKSYDASLLEVLRDLADRGNYIWEYRRDPKTGEQSIEWTQIGQRETDVDADSVSYTVIKDSSQVVEETAVYGASRSHIARFRANVETDVGLPNSRLQELSETVRNPRTGERFERNEDYEIDYEEGTIKATDNGLMEDGTQYEAEYTYQTYGDYTLPGVENPRRLPPQDISNLSSNTACAQAARTLINDLQSPQFEAELTIPQETIQWSLADALNVEGLETNGQSLRIRNVEQRPGETTLTLGIGRDVSEIIQDIENRVSSVSRNS